MTTDTRPALAQALKALQGIIQSHDFGTSAVLPVIALEARAAIASAQAALAAAQEPVALAGWVAVPLRPTAEMETAWMDAVAAPDERPIAAGYRAMLAAAPAAPAHQPLTAAQRLRLWSNSPEHHKDATSRAAFERIVTLTERAHSITGDTHE